MVKYELAQYRNLPNPRINCQPSVLHLDTTSLCQHFYPNIDTTLPPSYQKWFIAGLLEKIPLRIASFV